MLTLKWDKQKWTENINPIPPRLFSNLFPLGGGRHVSHPVELDKNFFCTKTSVSVV